MRASSWLASAVLAACGVSISVATPASAACDLNPDKLGALYRVVQVTNVGATTQATEFEFMLWRDGDQIAHELPERGLAEFWHRGVQKNIRLIRHFDAHQTGIEFFSEDLALSNPALVWESKRYGIPVSVLGLSASSEKDCDFTESVERRRVTSKLEATWLPGSALVKEYRRITPKGEIRLTLLDVVTDPDRVVDVFAKRRDYMRIDWSDVGDRENDPLVMALLAIGSIPHAVSGFTGHAH